MRTPYRLRNTQAIRDNNVRWMAARLMIDVHDINAQTRQQERTNSMSAEVNGLADIVRQAKDLSAKASTIGAKLNESAVRLTDTLSHVERLTEQIDSAQADLQAAVGQLSNGGPK